MLSSKRPEDHMQPARHMRSAKRFIVACDQGWLDMKSFDSGARQLKWIPICFFFFLFHSCTAFYIIEFSQAKTDIIFTVYIFIFFCWHCIFVRSVWVVFLSDHATLQFAKFGITSSSLNISRSSKRNCCVWGETFLIFSFLSYLSNIDVNNGVA